MKLVRFVNLNGLLGILIGPGPFTATICQTTAACKFIQNLYVVVMARIATAGHQDTRFGLKTFNQALS